MISISKARITAWADRIGIPNLVLAEHDLRLTYALLGIYQSPELKTRLAFKGGTALNKAYFGKFSRLSVDLDFNLIGAPREAVKQGGTVRKSVEKVLREQDNSYEFKYSYTASQTTLTARYTPLAGGSKQSLKVEVSTQESVPILGIVEKNIPAPEESETLTVRTYPLEELLATKIRALYERKKGRDVFDLACALKLKLDTVVIRKLVYYYFYCSGKIFNWNLLKTNMEEKAADKRFGNDAKPFLRPDTDFNTPAAMQHIIKALGYLNEPDEKDAQFLKLAKALIGRTKSTKKLSSAFKTSHPVRSLMESIQITPEAASLTVNDLRQ